MQTNITGVLRSRAVAIVLLVVFSDLSLALFVRGRELRYKQLFIFALTGFLFANVLRRP